MVNTNSAFHFHHVCLVTTQAKVYKTGTAKLAGHK